MSGCGEPCVVKEALYVFSGIIIGLSTIVQIFFPKSVPFIKCSFFTDQKYKIKVEIGPG